MRAKAWALGSWWVPGCLDPEVRLDTSGMKACKRERSDGLRAGTGFPNSHFSPQEV